MRATGRWKAVVSWASAMAAKRSKTERYRTADDLHEATVTWARKRITQWVADGIASPNKTWEQYCEEWADLAEAYDPEPRHREALEENRRATKALEALLASSALVYPAGDREDVGQVLMRLRSQGQWLESVAPRVTQGRHGSGPLAMLVLELRRQRYVEIDDYVCAAIGSGLAGPGDYRNIVRRVTGATLADGLTIHRRRIANHLKSL